MTNIPLEDQFNDVLGKAIRGTGISPQQLAEASGVPLAQVRAAIDGQFDASVVRAMAGPLGLVPDRLVALGAGTYAPAPVEVEGLRQFNTPFDDMTVNAYLVWDPASRAAALFDTGSDVSDALAAAAELAVRIEQVFITHSHGDHIYDLDRLLEKTRAKAWTPRGEEVAGAETFVPGTEFSIGALHVETRLTRGHARGGVTYVVTGLAVPLAICGDAMFAGSMGGGMISYADALRTNRAEILSLAEETVLAPGHGPLTTVGEQRAHNPFFP
jgi:glyoxylase-like metal-dependent hydrolase (beta-lactamase superfamily II)